MSHVFAPSIVSTENRTKSADTITLAASLMDKAQKAISKYKIASEEARRRDDMVNPTDDLFAPLNENAIAAASILMIAALRAAEIAR
jgi:hypothetical protein